MNGELAQLVTIATYATTWLRQGASAEPPDLLGHSAFQFVHDVGFVTDEVDLALTEWLGRLREVGALRVWLAIPEVAPFESDGLVVPAHQLAAISGATQWFLLVEAPTATEVWAPGWDVGHRDDPDRRIWDVTYRGAPAPTVAAQRPSVVGSAERLGAALTAAESFARPLDLSPWPGLFASARAALDEPPDVNDRFSPAYPDDARRLFAAAASSWVFGGMGSWNDLGFDDSTQNLQYIDVSGRLYEAMLTAFVAATNAEG